MIEQLIMPRITISGEEVEAVQKRLENNKGETEYFLSEIYLPIESNTPEAQVRDAVANLFLLDLAANLGGRAVPGEARTEIVAVWQNGEIVGMAGLHPTVILDAHAGKEVIKRDTQIIALADT